MIDKITLEELNVFETLCHPKSCAEILFHDMDDLGSFSKENEFGIIRNYQIPFQSYGTLFFYDKSLSPKENFKIKKGLSDGYALGGRLTGKTLVELIIDVLIGFFHKTFKWGVVSSFDALHLRGVLEKVIGSLENHAVLKLLNPRPLRSPAYKVTTDNGCLLESVNENLTGKNPGGQWYQKHVDTEWAEECSFITEEINGKKLKARSELGCIFRYSGMTTFSKNSPIGRIFNDLKNKKKIINLPSYVNPNYTKEDDDEAILEFGGINSTGYQVQVLGKIVEYGDSVFDMERVRDCYHSKLGIKCFEINKDNFFRHKEIIVLDKPNNIEEVIIALDKGEGAAPTEIIVLFKINGVYLYHYNITCYKLKVDEDEDVVNFVIESLKANIIAIDITSGTGKSLFSGLSKKYPENIVGVSFNEKINIDFERDSNNKIIYDNNGKPTYRQEYIVDWSIQQLKNIFYNKKISCFIDMKLDSQINGVVVMKSGMRTIYGYKTVNHLFQAFQVFAIAHWLTEFKNIQPIQRKNRLGTGAFGSV
jgi:hypothetical protein